MKSDDSKNGLYGRLFDQNIDMMMIVNPDDFSIVDVNNAAMSFYGYNREEFRQLRWTDLVDMSPTGFIDSVNLHREGHPRKQCRHLLKTGEIRDVELRISHIAGVTGKLLFIMIDDITDRCREDAAMKHKLGMLELMIDTLPNPIFCKDRNGRYVLCNGAFEKFFGRKRESIYGLSTKDLIPGDENSQYHAQDMEMIRDCEEQISQSFLRNIPHSDIEYYLKNREPIEYELPLRNAEGKIRDILVRKDIYVDPRQQAGIIGILFDVTDRNQKEEELRMLHTALECTPELIVTMDFNWKATFINNSFTALLGYRLEEINHEDSNLKGMFTELLPESDIYLITCGINWQVLEGEGNFTTKDGRHIPVSFRLTPIIDATDEYKGILAIMTDMREVIREKEQKRLVELQLRQAQKLEAIGHLAAGIAHELNTPIQFVGDNINFLNDTFNDFIALFRDCSERLGKEDNAKEITQEEASAIREKFEEIDFEYLAAEIPAAFEQSQDGIKRISDIVRAMKEFSHPGSGERGAIDINKAIMNTVTIARNEWKYVAEVKLELDKEMPMVPCYEGEFKQVILNILVNAAHAIGDVVKTGDSSTKGEIIITTRADRQWAYIDIADTGAGIPEKCRNKVFDPFFTTKEPGRGTGQGLAISYDVIVNKHHGKIDFETKEGKGTVFHLCLPME